MEVAVVVLSVAVAVLAVMGAALAGTVPFVLWRTWKLEAKIEELDEVVVALMEAAGIKPGDKE